MILAQNWKQHENDAKQALTNSNLEESVQNWKHYENDAKQALNNSNIEESV